MSEHKTWADFPIEEINEADESTPDGEQFLTEAHGVPDTEPEAEEAEAE